jgi:hypothetical protein
MDQLKTGIPVLASFPELDKGTASPKSDPPVLGLLASSGRLINQAASAKLLAGITLFLLVGAVLPWCIGKGSSSADVTASKAKATASPQLVKDAAEAQKAAAAVQSAVRVAAKTGTSPGPVPPAPEMKRKPQESLAAQPPMMASPWNVPGESAVGNQPAAVRPVQYEADTRGNSTPWIDPEKRR